MAGNYPMGVTDAQIDALLGDDLPEFTCGLCGERTAQDLTCRDCRCPLCPGCVEGPIDAERGLAQCESCAHLEAGQPCEETLAHREAA